MVCAVLLLTPQDSAIVSEGNCNRYWAEPRCNRAGAGVQGLIQQHASADLVDVHRATGNMACSVGDEPPHYEGAWLTSPLAF
jgi:hypothetical protein